MAEENGGKVMEVEKLESTKERNNNRVVLLLRLVAFVATIAATIVMALNKQTKTFAVATVGTSSIQATLTAKFQHTPAFVFFVIANGIASLHNICNVFMDIFFQKLDYKGLRVAMTAILDMLVVALLSGGVNAAVFMAELGKNGNTHARWDKICDKFGKFCDHGGWAIISSFVGLFLLLVITITSIVKLLVKPKLPQDNTVNVSVAP